METSFLYLKKDFQRRTKFNNKIFFFVEKSPRRQRATPKVCTWAREEENNFLLERP